MNRIPETWRVRIFRPGWMRQIAGALLLIGFLSVACAQDTIVTFSAPAESASPENLSDTSVGFELYSNNEMYWWSGRGVGGEIPLNCQIGYNYNEPNAFTNMPLLNQSSQIDGVARDSEYFYFADNQSRRIYRKAVWAQPSDSAYELPTPYTPPGTGYELGAVMMWNGAFYWSDYNGSYFDILSVNTDGTNPQFVRSGSGNKIIKMIGHTYGFPFQYSTNAIFALTSDGVLLRMDISPSNPNNVVLATGVTDFAVRDESQFVPPFTFRFFTTVYAAIGQVQNLNSETPPGSILAINAGTGAASTIYTASGGDQVTAVEADTTNIYWTEQPVTCNPPFACILGDYSTYRQSRPANYSSSPGSAQLIGLPGGSAGLNLRSDGQWLYFINGTTIKRLSTGAPAVQLDVVADGLEVVQAIQNLDSQVPLVANHDTYVRGYAHINNYGISKTFYSTALLHGFRNGVEFPDSPIYPVQSTPMLSGAVTLPQLRGDTKHSFLFKLPASWVKSGPDLPAQLTFTMTANPDLAIPETSPQPLTNNTVSLLQPAALQDGLTPNLVTMPLVVKQGPIYYYYLGGFQQFAQRGLTLLPAEYFNIHPFLITDPQGDWNDPPDLANTNYNLCEDAWDKALSTVDGAHLWSDPYQGDDEHFVGMLNPNAPTAWFSGIARLPGKSVVVIVSGGADLAHELGHNYGRKHIDCGDFTNYPDQTDFDIIPYPCSLGNPDMNLATATYGYDPQNNIAIPPSAASDVMTYSSPQWVSAFGWDSDLGVPPLNNVQPRSAIGGRGSSNIGSGMVMLVRGTINDANSAATLDPFYIVPESVAPAQVLADSRAQSAEASRGTNPVSVVFLDGSGNLLSQVAVATEAADGNTFDRVHVSQYVDVPAGAQAIRLVQGGQILAERFVSPHPPTINVGAPVIDPIANTLHLGWSASDADNDPLLFTLQFSADDGNTWEAIRTDYPYLDTTFAMSLLPGGTQCLLRVIATDGANTAVGVCPAFSIPLHPPLPFIDGATEGEQVPFDSGISLLGLALDAQNGSQSNLLYWTLSGPTPMNSTEPSLSLAGLSPGAYTATLTATDTVNLSASKVLDFTVLPPAVPDGPATDFNGMGNSDGYTNSTYIPLPLEDGSLASVRMYHASGQLYIGFYNLKFGGVTPRSVGLLVDPTSAPPASPSTNDFGFFVNENGAPYELQGNGTTFTTLLTPPPGYAAAIHRGSNAWTAELTIPDSQLGGWGHPASVMIAHGPVLWPSSAATNEPSTWAEIFLGANPPVEGHPAPVANAGPPLSISLSSTQTISLDGSQSYDVEGYMLAYAWTQTGGPSVTLSNYNTATPSFTVAPVTSETNLTFQLIVNNGFSNSAPGTVQVTLLSPPAQPPAVAPASGAALRSDGTLELRLAGAAAQLYEVQTSSNLVDWADLKPVYADYAGRITFEEAGDRTNYPERFYRAVSQ